MFTITTSFVYCQVVATISLFGLKNNIMDSPFGSEDDQILIQASQMYKDSFQTHTHGDGGREEIPLDD